MFNGATPDKQYLIQSVGMLKDNSLFKREERIHDAG